MLEPGDLVRLEGPLGAGKTFIVRAIARGLGVPTSERITSPTFNIVCEYPAARAKLVHADLYRLRDDEAAIPTELERLGLKSARDEGAILCAEWADGIDELLGGAAEIVVAIALDPRTGARQVALEGEKAENVRQALTR